MDARDRQAAADQLGAESYKVMGSHPAEDVLRDASDRAHEIDRALTVDTAAVEGEPVDAIVALAKQRKVDLIVVGNRGMAGIKGRILGSVPNGVAHKAECDVLIVDTT
jgi:nucleotide-binding universal stress UspA family protein